ncbi:MAG: peptidylprolyl isomerase [Candidatus Sedimenticola endophacoides]
MNDNNQEIVPGSRVTLHLALATDDGFEALSTFGEEPATIVLGDGQLTEGLELALYGCRAGERQSVLLHPEQAFGPRDEGKVQTMQRDTFLAGMDLERGLVVAFAAPNGTEVAGIVLELDGQEVTVDFNHPLAGRDTLFRFDILEVRPPSAANRE